MKTRRISAHWIVATLSWLSAGAAAVAAERRDCAMADAGPHASETGIVEACLVWGAESAGNRIVLTDRRGISSSIPAGNPTYPWATVHLLTPTPRAQWLVTLYKSDVDRPDGKTNFVEVFELTSRRKMFEAFAAESTVQDFDRDSRPELVLYRPLTLTRYSIQLGWPFVYELDDAIRAVEVDGYPSVKKAFLDRAENLVAHLRSVCRDSGAESCVYKDDIDLVNRQIGLMKAP
jgi:hypothetical protein